MVLVGGNQAQARIVDQALNDLASELLAHARAALAAQRMR
jgi:hypothetical protein